MSEWRGTTLGNLSLDVSYGYTASANFENGQSKFLRITDIQNGIVNWKTVPYCSIDHQNYQKYKLLDGDIVIARTGNSTGENYLFCGEENVVFASYLVRFRIDKNIAYPRFVWYTLRTPDWWQFINNSKTGSAQAGANAKVLGSFPILLPPLPEQKAIARILGSLDDKIELNRRMNETLEAMARAIFKDWFVDFGPTRAKMEGRVPYLPEPIWSLFPDAIDPLSGLPIGWQLVKIRDICLAIYSGGTPSTKNPENWGGDIPWFSSGETRNTFIIDTERKITDAGVQSSSTRKAPPLATVIAGAGQGNTRGQTSLLGIETYINQSVVALVANNDVISPHFLFFDLERRYEEFRRISDAHSSRGSLTTKLLAELESNLPDHLLAQGFESICSSTIQKCFANLLESRTLAELRDALLPKLMSGEIRVKDAERQVEEVL